MRLYKTGLTRIHLTHGVMEMIVIVHAANPQQAGRVVNKRWPEWTRTTLFYPVNGSVAFNLGISTR